MSEECAKYTGHVGRTKLPFFIRLYEIGAGIIDRPGKERMSAYRNLWTKGIAHPWMLDPIVGRAWSNRPLAWLGFRQAAERQLRRPRTEPAAAEVMPTT